MTARRLAIDRQACAQGRMIAAVVVVVVLHMAAFVGDFISGILCP